MEVPFPEVKSRFNFRDPEELAKELEEAQNGSYSQKLAEFMNSETQRLREKFMPRHEWAMENLDAYEQVWEASGDLIKRSMLFFWYSRFEWDDIESGARELEVMKAELELKFCDFKREMDSFRGTTLYLSSFIMISQIVMDMHQQLKEMALKIYPLFRRDFGTVTGQFELFKCSATMSMSHKHDDRISEALRWNILERQIHFIVHNLDAARKTSRRLVRDILPMGDFISRWHIWLLEEASKLVDLVTSPDLKLGKDASDLMTQIWLEMLRSLTLPREYGLVFYHPNKGKVPIGMLC